VLFCRPAFFYDGEEDQRQGQAEDGEKCRLHARAALRIIRPGVEGRVHQQALRDQKDAQRETFFAQEGYTPEEQETGRKEFRYDVRYDQEGPLRKVRNAARCEQHAPYAADGNAHGDTEDCLEFTHDILLLFDFYLRKD